MIADEIRRHRVVGPRFRVAPLADGSGQETFLPLGYRSGKRIDVVVAGELVGLQLGAGYDALGIVLVDLVNDGRPVTLARQPAVPVNYEYDRMVVRIANEYDVRFRNA